MLVVAESDEAVIETLRLAESALVTGDHTRISGVMGCCICLVGQPGWRRFDKGGPPKRSYPMLGGWLPPRSS